MDNQPENRCRIIKCIRHIMIIALYVRLTAIMVVNKVTCSTKLWGCGGSKLTCQLLSMITNQILVMKNL